MAPTDLDQFEVVFRQLIYDLRKHCREDYELPNQVWEWFEKVSFTTSSSYIYTPPAI